MSTRIRFLNNVVSPSGQYLPDSVAALDDTSAARFMAAGDAIPEGPSPSGVFATLYTGAGYTRLLVPPSVHTVLPSGSKGGFYIQDDYHFQMVVPVPEGEFIDGDFYLSPDTTRRVFTLKLVSQW